MTCDLHRLTAISPVDVVGARWCGLKMRGERGLLERMSAFVSSCASKKRVCDPVALSPKDIGLLRDSVKGDKQSRFVGLLGEKWGIALSRYAWLSGCVRFRDTLLDLLVDVRGVGEEHIIEMFKGISREAIEYSVGLGFGWWSFFMDIHVVGGYDTVLNRKDVMAGIAEEVGVPAPPLSPRLEAQLLDTVTRIVGEAVGCRSTGVSLSHFANFRDYWSTAGASTVSGKVVLEARDGKRIKVGGKLASSLQFSDSEIVDKMFSEHVACVKPFRKEDEAVKTRVVYGYDFWSYLRCAFVDCQIASWECGGPWLPLGYSKKKKADMRLRILASLGAGGVAVSLDQSAFDTRQHKKWVAHVIRTIFEVVASKCDESVRDDIVALGEVELRSFEAAVVPGVCSWEVGVPSGHRWTALIDSVLNRAAAECVAKMLGFTISDSMYQGDDAWLMGYGTVQPEAWASAYRCLGLEVNADKTWISSDGCDFLHEIYGNGMVRAFPARVARSVIWKKPNLGAGGVENAASRLRERMADCLKGVRRGLVRCKDVAWSMLSGKCSKWGGSGRKRDWYDAFVTPSYLGGFGFGVDGRSRLSFEGGVVSEENYSVVSGIHRSVVSSLAHGRLAPILARLSKAAFLRTSKVVVSVEKVLLPKHTPGYGSIPTGEAFRTDFCIFDGVSWCVSLNLEMWKRGVLKFGRSEWLPDPQLRLIPKRAAIMKLRSYERWRSKISFDLCTTDTTGESWATLSDYLHRIWLGLCGAYIFAGRASQLEEFSASVLATLHRYVTRLSPAVIVRV